MSNYVLSEYGNYSVYLRPGKYLFECWGAQGGYVELENSGRGAYVSGIIRFHEWKQLFLFVGQKGVNRSNLATFNGGGSGYQGTDSRETPSYSCSGGGATDIRLVGGEWDDMTSLLSRIMVAAGGGGEVNFKEWNYESFPAPGGFGGTVIGGSGSHSKTVIADHTEHDDATGGEQKKGGAAGGGNSYNYGNPGRFGIGGSAKISREQWPSSGAGSGYFGGGSGGVSRDNLGSGAGGSSFVSGDKRCAAIIDGNSEDTFVFDGSVHPSGYKFTNIEMKSGNESFLSPFGILEKGHFGNGAIHIQLLSLFTFYQRIFHFQITTSIIIIIHK